jgi:hypothetical protein
MGQIVGVGTATAPIPGAGDEVRVTASQTVLMGHLVLGRLRVNMTLNGEGLTMPNGEPTIGSWGEGFVDRRHPHTYLHEVMASWVQPLGGTAAASLSAGKGFVAFGSDDPMVRPLQRYPVNHHLAQILERFTAIAGVRTSVGTVEASLFNGDEPETPAQWPRIARFGDSWAVRATVAPFQHTSVQASHARVRSPEHRPGAGTDQRKWSVSARHQANGRGRTGRYLLAEWARTSEAGGFFTFSSLLGEGALTRGAILLSYRVERTDRPEEERLPDDAFRSARPHLENAILGTTRFVLQTVHLEHQVRRGPWRISPFVEVTLGSLRRQGATGVFDPAVFYGGTSIRTLSAGARLSVGPAMWRMGRYGVVAPLMASMASPPDDLPHEEHDP